MGLFYSTIEAKIRTDMLSSHHRIFVPIIVGSLQPIMTFFLLSGLTTLCSGITAPNRHTVYEDQSQ